MIVKAYVFGMPVSFEKGKIVVVDGCKFVVEAESTNLLTIRPLSFEEIEQFQKSLYSE